MFAHDSCKVLRERERKGGRREEEERATRDGLKVEWRAAREIPDDDAENSNNDNENGERWPARPNQRQSSSPQHRDERKKRRPQRDVKEGKEGGGDEESLRGSTQTTPS